MKVIKIGGGCLNGKETIAAILDLLVTRGRGNLIVVSALGGVTDLLLEAMPQAVAEEEAVGRVMDRLKHKHMLVARHLIRDDKDVRVYSRELGKTLARLERLFYGLHYTKDVTPRMVDAISGFGEKICAQLLAAILNARGSKASCRLPEEIGVITDGKFGDATALLAPSENNFQERLACHLNGGQITIIPGFYGVNADGETTTFGRGGSDYSAAVFAAISGAEVLEIWKDVDGFLSADPKFVPQARLIPELAYDEAAELAYFGAKILHPRTVEPLRKKGLSIVITNTLRPDKIGSRITARGKAAPGVIKSVAHTTDIAILKVHASGVGKRRGILGEVAAAVAARGVNIKSVVTSQTCISLLLSRRDLEPAAQALAGLHPRPYRKLEKNTNKALIAVVGKGLSSKPGIAAACFSAAAQCQVNIEMIAFGPSPAALYFIVRETDLHKAVTAIHTAFFANPACALPRKA
ncbi:aspartate kinase [Desulfonatronum lacustre]|uniref:aspartate kinase n=1 Tax=Desulfonatronum lacustre TaxID=66849 RepID=UPI00048EFF7C|nr:aspartate kinase [Desulfonatronum lacustre]